MEKLKKDKDWQSIKFFNDCHESFTYVEENWHWIRNTIPESIRNRLKIWRETGKNLGLPEHLLRPSSVDVGVIENPLIKRMEENCKAIASMIIKRELNHKERTALLFCYMKLGKEGEDRLRDILKQQLNYRYSITEKQLNGYRNKEKYGIRCETLLDWGVCRKDWFENCQTNRLGKEAVV